MLCNILLIFSVLPTYPMVVRCLQKNDLADVVIAVDSANLQSFPSALEAFFRSIAKNVKPVSPDNIRVSLVHYSTTVRVALPLKNGTNPSAIEGVRFENNERSNPMKLEEIASAVREKALKQDLGKRKHAPSVVVILARSGEYDNNYNAWIPPARQKATIISQEMTADIVVMVNSYSTGQFFSYFPASAEQGAMDVDHRTQDERSVFEHLSQKVFDRLQSALSTCHFVESRSGPCHYKKNNCVTILNRQPDRRTPLKYVRYCPQSDYAKCNDAEECERKCASATVWSTCVQEQCHLPGYRIRRPKDDSEETVLIYERCMQFENYTELATRCEPTCNPTGSKGKSKGTTSGPPGRGGKKNGTVTAPSGLLKCGGGTGILEVVQMCLPLWLTLAVAVGSTFLIVLIAVCIQRAVFKRRLETEKRRLLETISTGMKKSQSGYYPYAVPTGSMKPRPGETREDSKLQPSFTSDLRTARSASGLTKQESLIKSDLGMKSGIKPATVSAIKPVVMVKSKSKSKSKTKADGSGGSSEMGISSIDKPPSLTTRTIDELIKQEYKKSGGKPTTPKVNREATLRSQVDAKPGRLTKSPRSELRSLSRQTTKRKDMRSTGYRE